MHYARLKHGTRLSFPPTETAAELLDLLLRSRWFADSLFGQLFEQSRSTWIARLKSLPSLWLRSGASVHGRLASCCRAKSVLCAGVPSDRPPHGGAVSYFVAEQIRPARLVILEVERTVGGITEQAFEFDGGWLLSQRLANRQFHRDLLNRWQLQIEDLHSALESPLWETASSHRFLVGEDETVRFLKRLAPRIEIVRTAGAADFLRPSRWESGLELARNSWIPWCGPPGPAAPPLHRARYLPLLRKGPPWKANDALPPELLWNDPEAIVTTLPPLKLCRHHKLVRRMSSQKTQSTSPPAIAASQGKTPKRRIALMMLAASAATMVAAAVGWIGGRTWRAESVRWRNHNSRGSQHLRAKQLRRHPPHSPTAELAGVRVEDANIAPVGLILLDELQVVGSGLINVVRRFVLKTTCRAT